MPGPIALNTGQIVMQCSDSGGVLDELREFLEADVVEVRADPEFKERLRRKLWRMVQRCWGGASNPRS